MKLRNINQNWKFIRENMEQALEKDFNDSTWQSVNLPHTWNAIDGANGFAFYKGACWYRKWFELSDLDHDNQLFVEFNGANSVADVYVNGTHLGQHRGGYSTFRFDMTGMVEFGKPNLLAVRVDNTVFDDVYPQAADFTFYGGIYRDVNIISVNKVHIDLMDYGSQGVYITPQSVHAEEAKLNICTRLKNEDTVERKVRLWVDILDRDGVAVTYASREVFIPPAETSQIDLPAVIQKPNLWNGRKNPYLYEARVHIESFNEVIDETFIPFGVRFFSVSAENGFFLNGEHLPLNGVSRHQDRKDKGWAISHADHEEDLRLIKELGATSIRLAHYQHDQYFYNLCNREGMVLWAEIPFISVMSKNELEGINARSQMIELIRQNYNHPAIIFWGVQNEIQIGGERPEVRRLVKELSELVKQEDPSRLSTLANVFFTPDRDEFNFMTDLVGYNKYYGWYTGKAEDFSRWCDKFHRTNPTRPLCISEYGAEGIIQYHNDDPKVNDYSEEYHALYHETVWNIFSTRPYLWGTYVWNMFDFGANIRDEGGVKGRNNKGLVTYDRKIKKDAYYMYKAHWSNEKFVHITGKRYIDRADQAIHVKVYSNCAQVTLFINGVQSSQQTAEEKIFIFKNIPLQAGLNEISVVGNSAGQEYCDRAFFNRVSEPNPSYIAPKPAEGNAANWFIPPDFANVEVEELIIPEGVYSSECSVEQLYENQATRAIIIKYFGNDFDQKPMFKMLKGMSIDTLAEVKPEVFTEKLIYIMNKELMQIKKP